MLRSVRSRSCTHHFQAGRVSPQTSGCSQKKGKETINASGAQALHSVLHVLPKAGDSELLPSGAFGCQTQLKQGSAGPLAGPEEAGGLARCLTEPGGDWVAGSEAEAGLEDLEEIQGNQTEGGKGVSLPATWWEPPG